MTKANVFFIVESIDYDDKYFGFAFSSPDITPKEIQNWIESKPWKTLKLELKNGSFPDYLINDLNIPLFSSELKVVIDRNVRNKTNLIWYPVEIISDQREIRTYYYLKFKKTLNNVIDLDKSQNENYKIKVPYFIKEKIDDIFRCDYDESYLLITNYLKEKIKNYSGLDFETWTDE